MTASIVSSPAMLSIVTDRELTAHATRVYRTRTSFAAVHFDQFGKGRIAFLPSGARLHIVGPSSCLPRGIEVMVDRRLYNIFEIDVLERSMLISGLIRAKGRANGSLRPEKGTHHGKLLPLGR